MNLIRTAVQMIVITFICSQAYAQQSFQSGYIIDAKGDTLRGEIDYRNWSQNPEKITFRSHDGIISEKTPEQVKLFAVAGEQYLGVEIDLSISAIELNDLDMISEPIMKTKWVFLQTIYDGEKSLYFHTNRRVNNFYIGINGELVHLVYKSYLKIDNDGIDSRAENNKYLGQLRYYLRDCPKVMSRLERVRYNQTSLVKLFENYNECIGDVSGFKKEKERTKVELGLVAGASLTSLSFTGIPAFNYMQSLNRSSIDPTFGLAVDFILPRNKRKWSFRTELAYATFNIKEGEFQEYISAQDYSNHTSSFGLNYLKLNGLVRYNYPVGDISLFANVGGSYGYVISKRSNIHIEERYFFGSTPKTENVVLEEIRKYEQSVLFGIGLKKDRWSVETRYEDGNGMSRYTFLGSEVRKVHLLFTYTF